MLKFDQNKYTNYYQYFTRICSNSDALTLSNWWYLQSGVEKKNRFSKVARGKPHSEYWGKRIRCRPADDLQHHASTLCRSGRGRGRLGRPGLPVSSGCRRVLLSTIVSKCLPDPLRWLGESRMRLHVDPLLSKDRYQRQSATTHALVPLPLWWHPVPAPPHHWHRATVRNLFELSFSTTEILSSVFPTPPSPDNRMRRGVEPCHSWWMSRTRLSLPTHVVVSVVSKDYLKKRAL